MNSIDPGGFFGTIATDTTGLFSLMAFIAWALVMTYLIIEKVSEYKKLSRMDIKWGMYYIFR